MNPIFAGDHGSLSDLLINHQMDVETQRLKKETKIFLSTLALSFRRQKMISPCLAVSTKAGTHSQSLYPTNFLWGLISKYISCQNLHFFPSCTCNVGYHVETSQLPIPLAKGMGLCLCRWLQTSSAAKLEVDGPIFRKGPYPISRVALVLVQPVCQILDPDVALLWTRHCPLHAQELNPFIESEATERLGVWVLGISILA